MASPAWVSTVTTTGAVPAAMAWVGAAPSNAAAAREVIELQHTLVFMR
jgi:hypothetical protein